MSESEKANVLHVHNKLRNMLFFNLFAFHVPIEHNQQSPSSLHRCHFLRHSSVCMYTRHHQAPLVAVLARNRARNLRRLFIIKFNERTFKRTLNGFCSVPFALNKRNTPESISMSMSLSTERDWVYFFVELVPKLSMPTAAATVAIRHVYLFFFFTFSRKCLLLIVVAPVPRNIFIFHARISFHTFVAFKNCLCAKCSRVLLLVTSSASIGRRTWGKRAMFGLLQIQ